MQNTAEMSNVYCHRFGLFSEDRTVTLHDGSLDSGMASIAPNPLTLEQGQQVELRSIADWLDETRPPSVDVLKVDTEGCEVPILRGLGERLASIAVVYVEYHSESDRREIDQLLRRATCSPTGGPFVRTSASSPTFPGISSSRTTARSTPRSESPITSGEPPRDGGRRHRAGRRCPIPASPAHHHRLARRQWGHRKATRAALRVQDALNVVLDGRWFRLPPQHNAFPVSAFPDWFDGPRGRHASKGGR